MWKKSKNDFYWKLLQFQLQEQRIAEIFNIFRRNNLEPVLIKGWAAARNYPNPFDRLSVDIDIAVEPAKYNLAQQVLENNPHLGVDLHRGLRHLDTVEWAKLFEATELIKVNDTKIRILSAEDHLRVLCVHWLTDGGAYREKLLDIYHAINNRPNHFSWEKCLGPVERKRRKWITCVIGLAIKYLSLDLTDSLVAEEAKDIPKWIIKTVEYEWQTDIKLKPLENCLYNKNELWKQIKIRIFANPIQATILLTVNLITNPGFIIN